MESLGCISIVNHTCLHAGVGLKNELSSAAAAPQEIAEKHCGSGISYCVKVHKSVLYLQLCSLTMVTVCRY